MPLRSPIWICGYDKPEIYDYSKSVANRSDDDRLEPSAVASDDYENRPRVLPWDRDQNSGARNNVLFLRDDTGLTPLLLTASLGRHRRMIGLLAVSPTKHFHKQSLVDLHLSPRCWRQSILNQPDSAGEYGFDKLN